MAEMTPTSKYHRKIRNELVDVYDILAAYNVMCPAVAHAIKKLLMPGQRGEKSEMQDLTEARWSINRAMDLAADRQRNKTTL